jgi:DNA-binding transcriptional MerR regulator
MGLGVGVDEARRDSLSVGPGAGGGNHGRRKVDAGRVAARSSPPCHGARGATHAATDVEDPLRDRGAGGETLDEELLEGLQHLIERGLCIEPGASGWAVPQRRVIDICLAPRTHGRPHELALEHRWRHCATSSRLEVKRVANLDIAEVVRRSGIPASALRFCEEKGLIASISRRGQRRLFDPAVLDRLALIALGRQAGFSLEEIARIFAAEGRPRIDRRMLTAKAEELVQTIRKLSAMCDGLRHAAACPASSHMEWPTFRWYLNAAASGFRGGRRRKTQDH